MAFKMKGFPMQKGISPMKQVVPASESEKSKNTAIAKETDTKAEKINDLEDRIEFLQSDIDDAGQEGPTKLRAQLMKLKKALAKLRGN
tara:strand:+ start:582 stop:845 length:264 start_codon:yes stop_codon:yes gene_type:complete